MIRLFVGSVVIPFLFVIVMSGVEYLAKSRPLWELMTDVAWDLCILGIGGNWWALFRSRDGERLGTRRLFAHRRHRDRCQSGGRHLHPGVEKKP